ncbi:hypothetical protein RJT34_18541 [Clitoria ternatea]|uniref:15-cis-phytoene synthase n=1 Tax=Clitoria ternatea TaxID=43366 RepID=A0AAN9JB04_CLITE
MSLSFASPSWINIIGSNNKKPCCRRFGGVRSEATVVHKQRTESMSLADLHVQEVVHKQSQIAPCSKAQFEPRFLKDSYEMCRNICAEYAKTFYLGTLLMTEERQKAIWAIYVWCRRTDELVDGPNSVYLSSAVLDRWEDRLHDIFEGHPYDMLDVALTDTVSNFPLDIKVIVFIELFQK